MKRMLALLLALTSVAAAETLYVAQTATGNGSGADANNRMAVTTASTSTAWAAGAGKISAGDTLSLGGVFSSRLMLAGSGAAGSPVLVLFEPGAKFSAPSWTSVGSAIVVSGRSHLVIDGGTNGVIECTASGTGLANTANCYGIEVRANSAAIEIRNLLVRDIFVRKPQQSGSYPGNGVRFNGSATDCAVHHCTFEDMNTGVFVAYSGTTTNLRIHDNRVTNATTAIIIGGAGSGGKIVRPKIFHNTINLGNTGSDAAGGNTNHNDGIQLFANAGELVDQPEIYANTIGPDMGVSTATTAWVFLEGYVQAPLVSNNLFLCASNVATPTNGFVYVKGLSGYKHNARVLNNTIVSSGQRGAGINSNGGADGTIARNNVFLNLNVAIYLPSSTAASVTHNCFWNNDSTDTSGTNAFNVDPKLDASFRPMAGSPLINAGADLSGQGVVGDRSGAARTGAWDIGAYEFGGTPIDPPPPPPPPDDCEARYQAAVAQLLVLAQQVTDANIARNAAMAARDAAIADRAQAVTAALEAYRTRVNALPLQGP